ncbi:MAG: hypothetical protein WBZ45_05120, partial [Acidimicrobiia bacterium]
MASTGGHWDRHPPTVVVVISTAGAVVVTPGTSVVVVELLLLSLEEHALTAIPMTSARATMDLVFLAL